MLLLPPKAKAKHVSTIAEAVMQGQKFMWGDVQGENMMNHSKAATSRLSTSLLLSRIFMELLGILFMFLCQRFDDESYCECQAEGKL